jgi:hypothetical protein
MQYILTEEEIKNLVPKQELIDAKEQLIAVVDAFRSTDFCIQHKYGENCYCDDCPISSLNIKCTEGKHWKVCLYQEFSK